ncbi:UNVERIFIED_CONTAM: hypothetical protein Sangu_2958900 [Sesamum angustifolium]|uniref:Uncharacterized protein n=1 Tax=Sesamum angustifolium TaxID=2727405 RepID=A0AAW2IJW3_9LAMI
MAKVSWKDVCRPRDEGGQEICALEPLNRALMSALMGGYSVIILPFGFLRLLNFAIRSLRCGQLMLPPDLGVGARSFDFKINCLVAYTVALGRGRNSWCGKIRGTH